MSVSLGERGEDGIARLARLQGLPDSGKWQSAKSRPFQAVSRQSTNGWAFLGKRHMYAVTTVTGVSDWRPVKIEERGERQMLALLPGRHRGTCRHARAVNITKGAAVARTGGASGIQ
ncbi:MAG: hypothetical protein DMG68_12475 [Acidobacteria bacterium]|nr:MAG: hypothetical protein DMG68_12475 [Acidobacteriota bacterium]